MREVFASSFQRGQMKNARSFFFAIPKPPLIPAVMKNDRWFCSRISLSLEKRNSRKEHLEQVDYGRLALDRDAEKWGTGFPTQPSLRILRTLICDPALIHLESITLS